MQSPKNASPHHDEPLSGEALDESGVRTISDADRAALAAAEANRTTSAPRKVCPKTLAAHLPLVHQVVGPIARRVPANVQHGDLVGAGLTGLADSLSKNGGDSGASFESYARTRIRGAVLDELRSQDWLSRRARDAVNAIAHDGEDVHECVSFVGLDELVSEDEQEFCRSVAKDPEQHYARKEVARILDVACGILDPRERVVIKKHYTEDQTFKAISVELNISETRAFQLHARALGRLRSYFEKRPQRPYLQEVCPDSNLLEVLPDNWSDDNPIDAPPLDVA